MTLKEIAAAVGEVPVDDTAELVSLIFDEIEARKSVQEVAQVNAILLEEGVDVSGLCRKKHPT